MKRKIFTIGTLTLVAIIALFALNAATNKPNDHKNGFTRLFPKTSVRKIKNLKTESSIHGVAGVEGDSIFLKCAKPGLIYLFTQRFNKIDTFRIVSLDSIPNLFSNFYTFVEFPEFTILGGN